MIFKSTFVGLGLYGGLVARLPEIELIRGDGRNQRRPGLKFDQLNLYVLAQGIWV